MKKSISILIAIFIGCMLVPKVSHAQVITGFSEIQNVGVPDEDFIGSISLSEANFYEDDFNSTYLFPMQGICSVGNGNIAVIDNSYGRIHIVNSALQTEYTFGSLGTLIYPTDIAFFSGTFYVADPLSGNVKIFDEGGKYLGSFGSETFESPVGVAANKNGIYVSDYFKGKIYMLDSKYRVIKETSIPFPGGLTAKNGSVYAISMSERAIYVYNSTLGLVRKITNGDLYFPSDLAVDEAGNIYVVDRGLIKGSDTKGRVLVFSSKGKLIGTIGKPAASYPNQPKGSFLTPAGVAYWNGNVFVMDAGYYHWDEENDAPFGSPIGERLSEFLSSGLFVSDENFKQTSGPRLVNPLGATLDGKGNIWTISFSGTDGSQIIEFSPSGDLKKRISKLYGVSIKPVFCIFADKNGHILLGMENRITILDESGKFVSAIDDASLGDVRKITKGKDGFFYATLADKNMVAKFTLKNLVSLYPVCKFPSGIAQGKNGNFYITSLYDNKLYVYTPAFKQIRTIGGSGRGKNEFYVPDDVAVDKFGNIIVADTENGRLSVFNENGTLVYQSPRIFYQIASLECEDDTFIAADCFHNVIRILSENSEEKEHIFFASVYPQSETVRPGGEADFKISITNAGKSPDNYNIFAKQNVPPDWKVVLSKNSVSLPQGGSASINFSVRTPVNAKDGDSAEITITVSSATETKTLKAKVIVSTHVPPKILIKDTSVMVGKSIDVPIYANGLDSAEGITFTLSWPQTELKFKGIKKGSMFKNGLLITDSGNGNIVFAVSLTGGESVSGSGIVAVATFYGKEISKNLVKISNAYYVNPAGIKTEFDVSAGQITVNPYLFVNFSNGISSDEQNFTFNGKATPGIKVVVNGQTVKLDPDGSFTATVVLNSKENIITISAIAKGGEQTTIRRTVYYTGKKRIIIKLQIGNPMMTVNGVEMEIDPGRGTKPFIVNGWNRTVVPIRAIVESLGGTVGWEPDTRMVWVILNTTTINMWINKPLAKVDGTTVWIDPNNHNVCPIIANDRTFVPIRFVAESLGCEVLWDGETKTVTIIYEE